MIFPPRNSCDQGLWIPPRGFDRADAVSSSFWRFVISSVWIARFEGWEKLFDPAHEADADLIAAGHLHLTQISRLWKLDLTWDGLRPPAACREGPQHWKEWYQRLRAFAAPWWKYAPVDEVKSVEVSIPSDVLWFLNGVATDRRWRAICRHAAAYETLKSLNVDAELSFVPEPAPSALFLDEQGTLHLTVIDQRPKDWNQLIAAFPQKAFAKKLRIRAWGDGWTERIELRDRVVHEIAAYPVPWGKLQTHDRIKLRALLDWMNAPISHAPSTDVEPISVEKPMAPAFASRLDSLSENDVPLAPNPSQLCTLHQRLFRGLFPHAGDFKHSNTLVLAGSLPTVQPTCVSLEIEVLRELWERGSVNAMAPAKIARAIAAFHIRFQRIHPFADGNGRVGRLLLARQACLLNRRFEPSYWENRSDLYRAHLVEATRNNNVAPLMRWLHLEFGISDEILEPNDLALPVFLMRHT